MNDFEWHEGGCFCGAVRFRVRGEVIWKSGCTCNTCVKMHAAPYVVWAGFDRDNFEVIVGGLTQFRSSPHAIREFCSNCGSTLTYAKDARGAPELEEAARVIYVAVASLDKPEAYPPDEVVHTLEAIGWMHFTDDLPLRDSISPSAGHLQFGGIAESEAAEFSYRRIDPTNGAEN